MPSSDNSKLCLATVVSDNYVPGTLVMLHSFLKHNLWFDGDIILIHDELDEKYRTLFKNGFERVRLLPVSVSFKERIERLTETCPELKAGRTSVRAVRFQSLEAFRLSGYDRVLYCDGDLLFRKSVQELFDMDHPLICCPDGPVYQGRCRDRRTFAIRSLENSDDADVLRNTFNAGLMLIDNSLLTDDHYEGLLSFLDSERWPYDHTDQVILNLYFEEEAHPECCTYNYLLAFRAAIYKKHEIRLADAHVLHYNGHPKPWRAESLLQGAQEDAGVIKAYQFWYDAFIACLNDLHLNHKLPASGSA